MSENVKSSLTLVYRSGTVYTSSGTVGRGCAAYDCAAAPDSWLIKEPPEATDKQNVSRNVAAWKTSQANR